MQTFAETRGQLASLLSGADDTVGTTRTNRSATTSTSSSGSPPTSRRCWVYWRKVEQLRAGGHQAGQPGQQVHGGSLRCRRTASATCERGLSFTHTYAYTRADCPHYGELKGPSCFTAPLVPVRPDLPEVLLPQNYQPPKDLAPPPGTVIGPDGNLVAVGPPLINGPNPTCEIPIRHCRAWLTPSPPVPGTAQP